MNKASKVRLAILAVLFLAASISVYAAWHEDRRGTLTASFLNVGQGDAIFIEAPNGNQLLIDAGPDRSVLRELGKVMPFYDRSIDAVLMSHPDQDHIGGMPEVLNKYNVGLVLEPGVAASSSVYSEIENYLKIKNSKIQKLEARRGMEVDLGQGAVLEILFPDRSPQGLDTNNASIVARLVYGENGFLFTGDSPNAMEDYVASLNSPEGPEGEFSVKSDVLKVGHHGSKTSTDAQFVSAVSPQYAVISVGKDNKYGHPDQETLDILNSFGAQILRTDLLGRIVFKSDGENLQLK